jgi:hypothetical protein
MEEEEQRIKDLNEFLANRSSLSYPIRNDREYLIDIAMNDLITGNRQRLYDRVMITKDEAEKWIKEYEKKKYENREHLIDIAMKDLFTGNHHKLYDRVIMTHDEAVNWMYKNMKLLKYFIENRPYAILILEHVIKKTAPSVEGPSVNDMTDMIEILKKPVQVQKQSTRMDELDGGSYRRRTKHLKKHAKKHSNKHFKKSRKCRKYRRN